MKFRWQVAQAAEIRWWQHYLKSRPKADYLAWKREYWQGFLEKTGVSVNSNDRIIDAGCGPAGIFMLFDDNETVALDPLLDAYDEKLDHFQPNAYPNVEFVAKPLETYVTSKPFDKVFCLNAINHVADLDLCFDNLIALTRPKGKLIVSIDAHNFPIFKSVFRLLPGDILHPHQYDLEEYQQMLTSRNCTIENSILMKKEFFFDYHILVATKN